VRVGRAPLDEDAIRLIEQSNPGMEFDWTRILKGQDAPPEPRPLQQERRARSRPREYPVPDVRLPLAEASRPEVVKAAEEQPSVEIGRPAALADGGLELAPEQPVSPITAPTAVSVRLGPEGLARLRARHAEVLARITEKVTDPARREQLKTEAERLNPDTWVTDAEVVAGLEGYEAVFESLRGVIGRRRKRRRRRVGGTEKEAGATSASVPEEATEPDEPADDM
jgi:hypothetical protein